MTSNEFTVKVLQLAEEMISRIDATRDEIVCNLAERAEIAYDIGYQNGLSAAKDVIISLEDLFNNITSAEMVAELNRQLMEGVKENA